jgi:hypothetical protein
LTGPLPLPAAGGEKFWEVIGSSTLE